MVSLCLFLAHLWCMKPWFILQTFTVLSNQTNDSPVLKSWMSTVESNKHKITRPENCRRNMTLASDNVLCLHLKLRRLRVRERRWFSHGQITESVGNENWNSTILFFLCFLSVPMRQYIVARKSKNSRVQMPESEFQPTTFYWEALGWCSDFNDSNSFRVEHMAWA